MTRAGKPKQKAKKILITDFTDDIKHKKVLCEKCGQVLVKDE